MKLKLRHKLLLLIALPLILVLIYASIVSLERTKDLNDAKDIEHLAKTTELLSIVHLLQFERGKAITFAARPEESTYRSWYTAAEQSRQYSSQLGELKKNLITSDARSEITQTLEKIEKELIKIDELRSQTTLANVPQSEYIRLSYTQTIEKIHRHVSQLLKLAPGSEIFQLADSLNAIADLKETVGKERALISAILKKGSATNTQIRTLISFSTEKRLFSDKFIKLAPINFQENFVSQNFITHNEKNLAIFNKIILTPVGEPIIGDAQTWFNDATAQIDQLREIEKNINQELLIHAQKTRKIAFDSLFITLTFALVTISLIAIFAVIATGRLAEGFIKLRDSAIDFTNSGELKNIPIDSQDEIGSVAQAFNHFIEQLRETSQIVEKVAHGDFSQQVAVKSKDDKFALSLNHMIKTLHDTVSKIQQENWLKTGQSELAIKINNDQDIQELTQKAINYLARYLNAGVAAIYLSDDKNQLTLSASYAYTRRKNHQQTFEIGESLIGQAVKEKNTIILEEIPDDYISINSGLGQVSPRNLVITPLYYSGHIIGALELGFLMPVTDEQLELLKTTSENLAVALHAAASRSQLAVLLEETRAQSEELQAQQEALEQYNSDLQDQAEQLEESKHELESQKQQLSETNEVLEKRTEELSASNKAMKTRSKELEEAQQILQEKADALRQASQYKSEFLANMSHELRTPLNSLLLLAQTLKENDDKNLTSEQLEALSIIHGAGKDLLHLINDILDLSKVEAGKIDLNESQLSFQSLIQELTNQFSPLAKESNLNLEVNLSKNLPETIYTDPQRLQQILTNLLGNAIKFTDQGFVKLDISLGKNSDILFEVSDSGIGIKKKQQEAIFEAFQQADGSTNRKHSGTGLGLTISRKFAHMLGGEITLSSTQNKGSTFTLSLPIKPAKEIGIAKASSLHTATDEHFNEKELKSNKNNFINTENHENIYPISSTMDSTPEYNIEQSNNILIVLKKPIKSEQNVDVLKVIKDKSFNTIFSKSFKEAFKELNHQKIQGVTLESSLQKKSEYQQLSNICQQKNIPIHIIKNMSHLSESETSELKLFLHSITPNLKNKTKDSFNNILKGKRILVVDDDMRNTFALCKLLQSHGMQVIMADNGQLALEKLASDESIELAIMDIMMPVMDGYETISQIRKNSDYQQLPIIALTAKAMPEDRDKCLSVGANDYLAKPVDSNRLISTLKVWANNQ